MKTTRGELGILNVGAGDTKLSFDPKNPAERHRASIIVGDMIKRGFAIMVQVGEKDGKPLYQRAERFDPETCEYIVMGGPDETRAASEAGATPTLKPRRGRPRKEVRLPAERTHAVSIARSAGG